MNDSVFLLTNEKKDYIGTCFVIDNDSSGSFLATCGHVLDNCCDELYVNNMPIRIIENKNNEGLDLAIIYVKGLLDINPFFINDNSSDTDKGRVIGYTNLMGAPKKEPISNIKIKNNIEYETEQNVNLLKLYTREEITSGYSGSPVLCEKTNKVIGIVNIKQGDSINYAICSKHICEIYEIKNEKQNGFSEATYRGLVSSINNDDYNYIKKNFERAFEKSLETFSGQPKIWVKPRIHTKQEDSNTSDDKDTKVDVNEIINNPEPLIIKAREQYGLTTLSNYLVKEAWNKSNPSLWLMLDANEIKPHLKEIEKLVTKKLKELNLVKDDIECIVIDEFSSSIKESNKLFQKINEFFYDKPIIVMYTIVDNPMLNESIAMPKDRVFKQLYLWALPRNDIRQVVVNYNNEKYLGNEDEIVNKIVTDLEVLNIPRTALNCLTILKISEIGFDDSPVNRTEMLSRILSLLFNVEDIPVYKSRPDLKDTEYTLGYFCELLLRQNVYSFTRKEFLDKLNTFCKDMVIDLDIDIMFDILYKNNIFVERNGYFCFKFSYWIFYFAAQRMHKNKDFAEYILNDMNYASYPELIEFYTGIDRSRDDALKIMINDIKDMKKLVNKKCGLSTELNIFDLAQWKPSQDRIEEMHSEISEGVMESNLPDEVKDEYADQSYNRARPLNQSIHKILEEYSLLRLMKSIQASSKALRNSDYADPKIKCELLNEILTSWEQIITVIVALSPILSQRGKVTVDGASFVLSGGFSNKPEERFNQLLPLIPINVVGWFKDDLFSKRMGTLLFNHIDHEESKLINHVLNLLLINKRPKGWDKYIEDYIVSEHKNSYYLADVHSLLMTEYQYSFATEGTLRIMKKLIKMAVVKHDKGMKKPSPKSIKSFEKDRTITIPARDKELN